RGWVESRRIECCRDGSGEVRLFELQRRQLHLYGDMGPKVLPLARVLARALQRPAPEFHDAATLLGNSQELGRLEQTAPRMVPVQLRVEGRQVACVQG